MLPNSEAWYVRVVYMSIRCDLCDFVATHYRSMSAKEVHKTHLLCDHSVCCGKVQPDMEGHAQTHLERKRLRDWVKERSTPAR
jgi:hypothetical protein